MMNTASPQVRTKFVMLTDTTAVSPWTLDSYAWFNVGSAFNHTTLEPPEEAMEFYMTAQVPFLVVLFLLIVIGNGTVMAAISLSRERRRSRMNFFIMHLAVCDLLTGPLVVLPNLIELLTARWYAGDVICRIHKFTQSSVMYASTYMLVALSVDRLDAVARPMQFNGSWLRAKALIGTAWVLSLLFAVPSMVLFQEAANHQGLTLCLIDLGEPWTWRVYLTLIAIALFFLPACIICVCYVVIIGIIWRSSHLLQSSINHSPGSQRELLHCRSNPRTASQVIAASHRSSRGIIPQAKIRTIKMTFIIVLVFILCWSPYFVFNLCDVYSLLPHSPTVIKVSTFIQSLAPLNSAANPIIYGIFSTRICKYLRRIKVLRRLAQRAFQCCGPESPGPRLSGTDYTSMTETEGDIRLSVGGGDFRRDGGGAEGCGRVPYVQQKISEDDRVLLSLHVRMVKSAQL